MKSVSFTGHRRIENTYELRYRLRDTVSELIEQGYTDFYAGGAYGFDMMCEQEVLFLKTEYPRIKLHLVLPCREKELTRKWNDYDRSSFFMIMDMSDSVEYISELYFKGCMKLRNERLIEYADLLLCYYDNKKNASGTGQTVRLAQKKNISIINLAE